jgi:2-hydroxychromene-2-carboxylate isomerase
MLWAKRQGKRQFRAYHDRVFERFWRRELDIEDPEAIAAVLSEGRNGFDGFLAGAGRMELDTIRESAEAAGVFGAPSFIVEGELFWGCEHLADIRKKLAPLARDNPVRATPSS